MGFYIILYDTKRQVSVRTTSPDVADDLRKLEPKLMEIAWASGRECKISDGRNAKNYNVQEYKKILEVDTIKVKKVLPKKEIMIQGE